MNKYGGFNHESKYVIDNPYTPEPWLHYLIRVNQPGTETFCSGVTYTGGGFDVRGTHENTFVDTQLHLNDEDDMGRYIYIFDRDENELTTTTWLVQSYCMVGRGIEAVAHYQKNLPENMSKDQDVYMSEPYVYPEYVRGKGIDSHGRGGHTWLTGTAPTMHMALTEYIYGVRAHFSGLEIDPCVDPCWKEFSMERNFRGSRFIINFKNPNGVQSGIDKLIVDGVKISGNIVPGFTDNKTHMIEVIMG